MCTYNCLLAVHTAIDVLAHIGTHTAYAHLHTHMYTHIQIYAHTRSHTHTFTQIYKHAHTLTPTLTHKQALHTNTQIHKYTRGPEESRSHSAAPLPATANLTHKHTL